MGANKVGAKGLLDRMRTSFVRKSTVTWRRLGPVPGKPATNGRKDCGRP